MGCIQIWKDTDNAFIYAVDYIEKDFCNEVSIFNLKVNQTESVQLQQSIEMDKTLIEFYDGIEEELKSIIYKEQV